MNRKGDVLIEGHTVYILETDCIYTLTPDGLKRWQVVLDYPYSLIKNEWVTSNG